MVTMANILAGKAAVVFEVQNTQALRNLRKTEAAFQSVGYNMIRFGATIGAIGATMGIPFVKGLQYFAEFENQMKQVQAIAGINSFEFDKLSNYARELGKSTTFTAVEAAQGMTELARAGLKTNEIIATTADVLNLAKGTSIDLAQASQMIVNTMTQFKLTDSTRVADVLVAATNNSTQSITDMQEAMKYAGQIANTYNVSLEEVAASVATLAQVGIKGTMAGTAIRNAYDKLSTELSRKKLFKKLGIDALDAKKNLRPLNDLIQEIFMAMKGMGTGEQGAILTSILGVRPKTGAVGLADQDVYKKMLKAVENSAGTAKKARETMEESLQSKYLLFISALQELGIALGEALKPFAEAALFVGTKLVYALSYVADYAEPLVWLFAGLATGLTVLGTAVTVFGGALVVASTLLSSYNTLMAAKIGETAFITVAGGVLKGIISALMSGVAVIAAAGVGAAIGYGLYERYFKGYAKDRGKKLQHIVAKEGFDIQAMEEIRGGYNYNMVKARQSEREYTGLQTARETYLKDNKQLDEFYKAGGTVSEAIEKGLLKNPIMYDKWVNNELGARGGIGQPENAINNMFGAGSTIGSFRGAELNRSSGSRVEKIQERQLDVLKQIEENTRDLSGGLL